MKRIGIKITAIMLCVILPGILITAGIATVILSGVISDVSMEKVRKDMQNELTQMDSWLAEQVAIMTTLAGVLAEKQEDIRALEEYLLENPDTPYEPTVQPMLKSVLDNNDAYFDVYMGFPNGRAQASNGYIFDYAAGWTSYHRGWYILAMTDTRKAHITEPYVDAQTGDWCITVDHAVVSNGEVIGVVAADIFLTDLQAMLAGADLGGEGHSMLLDKDGYILAHPDETYAPYYDPVEDAEFFKKITEVQGGIYADVWRDTRNSGAVVKSTDENGVTNYYISGVLPVSGWQMMSVLPAKVVSRPITTAVLVVIAATLAVLFAAALLIFTSSSRIISKPISALTSLMKKAGQTGDLTQLPEDAANIRKYAEIDDDMGHLIAASAEFVRHVSEVGRVLETVADGDLTQEIVLLSDKDTIGFSLQKMRDNLNRMFREIYTSAAQVSSGSKQIADGSQELAQGSNLQAAAVEKLSVSIAEIAQKTKTNAEMAGRAAEFADTIKQSAEKGSHRMDSMMEAVHEINQASQNIGKVIKVIDDIAFQTNILALNAAVEAARAGQHGKGFAVVAEEVRNLAAKSADAAKDTGGLIANSIEKAELGARIAGETASSLGEIVSGISESSQIVSQIAMSSEEQSADIAQINMGIEQVAQVIRQNSATSESTAAASEQISGQSEMLEDLIARFKVGEG
ncbi:MAG: methyl-accepting chemotaxis protein [Oscillospiraceae bacterium]|nr:methyl-accepting chemotaxis protein [Oscillospiraceae bacterium]